MFSFFKFLELTYLKANSGSQEPEISQVKEFHSHIVSML